MSCIKIYLDQKDYSRIARGLIGQEKYKPYVDIYNYLLRKVENGCLKIFYSEYHILESLKYFELNNELWNAHCEVVDKLTMGNCIISTYKRLQKEIHDFANNVYKLDLEDIKYYSVYGKFSDAVNLGDIDTSFLDNIKKIVFQCLYMKQSLTQSSTKGKDMHVDINEFSNLAYESLLRKKNRNGLSEEITHDLKAAISKREFHTLIHGSQEERESILKKIYDHAFTFKRLVNVYGLLMPELKINDEHGYLVFNQWRESIEKLKEYQDNEQINYLQEMLRNIIKKQIIDKTIKMIELYADKYQLDTSRAKRVLKKSDLSQVPTMFTLSELYVLYFNKHLDNISVKGRHKGRKAPQKGDYIDLCHATSIPYVDIYLSDGFISELVSKFAKDCYGVHVFRDLKDLKKYLEKKLNC